MIPSVHHLTFVVRDLERALSQLQGELGAQLIEREELPARGVLTARFRIGDLWFVFVQPVGTGIPAQHLRDHGEGLLLISLHVQSIDAALAEFDGRGVKAQGQPRRGIGNWSVVDTDARWIPGTHLQLCQE